jgi:hypothetical protein
MGNTTTKTVTVKVPKDTEPPKIKSVTASPDVIKTNDHKMVPVTLTVVASDNLDAHPHSHIVSVKSSELICGTGPGDLSPDWEITGELTLKLRGECSDRGHGRDYTVTVETSDASGNKATKSVTVSVTKDREPPKIKSVTASPDLIRDNSHKMVPVTITVVATDNLDPHPHSRITAVTSNEAVSGLWKGDSGPDWQITGDLSVNLRAESSATGNGRTYTITIEAADQTGNKATKKVTVDVPKAKNTPKK